MRNVYFSFHYKDVWKVNQIRHSGLIVGARSAGFADGSLWEEAKEKNRRALEKLIADGLKGTTVTAVLIGEKTASRPWVIYEIEESIRRGNALLGIHINQVPNRLRESSPRGAVPTLLRKTGAPVHTWSSVKDFGVWVEDAWASKNEKPGLWAALVRAFTT